MLFNQNYEMYIQNGTAYCTSKQIAETFSRQHKHVLESIRNLKCSDSFKQGNFLQEGTMYYMTKNGFLSLTARYQNKISARETILKSFDLMDNFLYTLQTVSETYKLLEAAVYTEHEEPKWHHVSNECNLINRIVLGMTSQEYRKHNDIPKTEVGIRPYLTKEQLEHINTLQFESIRMIYSGKRYQDRRKIMELLAAS